jgi:RNA polymerase sigma-70 factor (ECF subfamily)
MRRQAKSRFEEIYRSHLDDVTRYVRQRVETDVVEDLVAETFVVCWRKLDELPSDALPWLYGVARNTIANHYRAAARRNAAAGASPARTVFQPVEQDDVLARAFARLSETDREVLRLVAWEHPHRRGRSSTSRGSAGSSPALPPTASPPSSSWMPPGP